MNIESARRAAKLLRLLALALFVILPSALSALDVATGEIESVRGQKVDFINYEGPQAIVQGAAEIRGIGASLAAAIGKPGTVVRRAGEVDRYAVIRAVDAATTSGLDADIILIGKDAVVDHIDNVRRIVAGYLETAWGYSRSDAATLAVFITVYNAVHRGDMAYFGAKYKAIVTKELGPDTAGLSRRWDEWPGKTRILIPLSSGARPGAAGAVSTGTISGKEVTEGLKSEPSGGIPERQALVDIKQKEVAEGQDAAAKAKADAEAAAAKAAAAQAQLAQAQKDLSAAQQAASAAQAATPGGGVQAAAATGAAAPAQGTAPSGAATSPAPAAGPGAAQTAQASGAAPEVAAAQQQVAEAQKTAEAAQADAAAKQAAADQAQAAVAAKQAEVAADRQAISQDQGAAIAAQVAQANAGEAAGILLLEIVDAGYPFARVDFVDSQTGKLLRASTLNTIRSRSLIDAGGSLVAVAGKEGGTGAVRLVALDKGSLAQTAQGEVDIFPESSLARIGDSLYAVIKAADGKYYLGRFGADLKEAARSKDPVNPFTFVVQEKAGLVVQAAAGGFLVLDSGGLAALRQLGL